MQPDSTSQTPLASLDPCAQSVARALTLLWSWHPLGKINVVLQQLGARNSEGKAFSQVNTKAGLEDLQQAGLLEEYHRGNGNYRLREPERTALYADLLEQMPIDKLRLSLFKAVGYQPAEARFGWNFWDEGSAVAIVRFRVFSGTPAADLDRLRSSVPSGEFWDMVFTNACLTSFNDRLLERVTPAWRWLIVGVALLRLTQQSQTLYLPFMRWTQREILRNPQMVPLTARLTLAEILLHQGDLAGVNAVLERIEAPAASAIRAGALAQLGHWAEAQKLFEAALLAQRKETGAKVRLFSHTLAWIYPYVLLAQGTPEHLTLARKFAIGEAGSRQPAWHDAWGVWVHAIDLRRGDPKGDEETFLVTIDSEPALTQLHRVMLRAWLAPELRRYQGQLQQKRHKDLVAKGHQTFLACDFIWWDTLLTAAEQVAAGQAPGIPFLVQDGREIWRQVLQSLRTLDEEPPRTEGPETQLLWSIFQSKGILNEIEPLERKRGVRGWGKARPISLSKIVNTEHLAPENAQVARAIYSDGYYSRSYGINRATALLALVGHPAVVFAEDPNTLIDVVLGQPEIQVVRRKDEYEIRIDPPIIPAVPRSLLHGDGIEEKQELEALQRITLVRESSQRLRVVPLTDAQRRAAHILAKPLKLPVQAISELQATLAVLAKHFDVQSDQSAVEREVAADPRLRAELVLLGAGLLLRLVVAPLGRDGPRLLPGQGRVQVLSAIQGKTVGAQRDLKTEKIHLNAVLDAFPFLSPPGASDRIYEWAIEDPEEALTLVEQLPLHPAIASLDWPKGESIRVRPIDRSQIRVSISSQQDWFSLQAEAAVDEDRVLRLQELLHAANQGSRFIPMGSGLYMALTRELRDRLQDLSLVIEAGKKQQYRVPALAASWLKELLEGSVWEADASFHSRLAQLEEVQEQQFSVPENLQATLRPYQEEGVLWMLRLAAAGFGACLADDMGLGKTLQAVAILLARASGGPALVVAPTSLCGNWVAEIVRFAPTLRPIIYGAERDRAASLEDIQAGDVLLVSYGLLLQAQEQFAKRDWHTLVVDEAQAIKNATAKRSLALFQLPGDFRLALSGTPVENHLTELWSIFQFCNSGLLGTPAQFNQRFVLPIERDQDRETQRRLRRLIAPFLLRRTKAQVLPDLPERTEVTLMLGQDDAEAAHYEALRREALLEAEVAMEQEGGQASFYILKQLMRLRRAACDPRLSSPDLGIVGGKVRAFAELATELVENGHKALVFSQFVDFLTLLREPLDAAGIRYHYLDGSTPAAERDRRVAAFQAGEGHFFLVSLKAGGFGLNLTAADYVIIADPWWNPAVEDQATGRAHRMGQTRPVTVYRLVTQGTLEEKIIALHRNKRALADGVLAEGEQGNALPTAQELLALMRDVES